MALKLAKDLKNAAAAKAGFDLQFTEGVKYDLDALASNKSRTDANHGLVVEVNKNQATEANIYSENISEGGLAIKDTASKGRVDRNDYTKYLLDRCGDSYNNKPSEIGLSATKIRINWEDGVEDTTLPSQVHTVYDEINSLKKKVERLEQIVSEK